MRKNNKFCEEGFTLIETLLALIIAFYGFVFIFGAFFKSLTALEEAQARLSFFSTFHNKIIELKLASAGAISSLPEDLRDSVRLDKQNIEYTVNQKPLKDAGVNKIDVRFSWFKGRRRLYTLREFLCLRETE